MGDCSIIGEEKGRYRILNSNLTWKLLQKKMGKIKNVEPTKRKKLVLE